MARLTHALASLRAGFDALSPGRDRASDGWIGDRAHQGRKSGHNPDDTTGSRPEYEDADRTAEVRGLDVDDDLRHPSVTMAEAIDRILATPEDRRRLSYVIYRRRIASAKSSWKWKPYTGSNPHDSHAHFSGAADHDDDGRPWSVATMGRKQELDVTLTNAQADQLRDVHSAVFTGGSSCGATVPTAYRVDRKKSKGNALVDKLNALVGEQAVIGRKLDAVAAVLAGQSTAAWLGERFAELARGVDRVGARVELVDEAVVSALAAADVVDLVDVLAVAGVDVDALAREARARSASTDADQVADVDQVATK